MHAFTCDNCDRSDVTDMFGSAINAADWHNTMTGHDVRVVEDGNDRPWILTDDGWIEAHLYRRSTFGGQTFCVTCDSPYCDLA